MLYSNCEQDIILLGQVQYIQGYTLVFLTKMCTLSLPVHVRNMHGNIQSLPCALVCTGISLFVTQLTASGRNHRLTVSENLGSSIEQPRVLDPEETLAV